MRTKNPSFCRAKKRKSTLFNSYGEVIGITTAKYSTSSSGTNVEGLGFAIPINDVKNIISDLIQYGYVTGKPYMGITGVTMSASVAQQYGVTNAEVLISSIYKPRSRKSSSALP